MMAENSDKRKFDGTTDVYEFVQNFKLHAIKKAERGGANNTLTTKTGGSCESKIQEMGRQSQSKD